jgi:hypothetical protein
MSIKKLIVGLAAFVFASGALAQTVATTATEGALVRETSIVKNQSKYASQSDRSFTVVRIYDFDVLGGSTAAVDLDPNADWKDLPDNSVITEVVVDVIAAVLPTNASASVLSVGGVTLYSNADFTAGIKVSDPDAKTTAADEVAFDAVVAPTSGYFTVTISGYQGQ